MKKVLLSALFAASIFMQKANAQQCIVSQTASPQPGIPLDNMTSAGQIFTASCTGVLKSIELKMDILGAVDSFRGTVYVYAGNIVNFNTASAMTSQTFAAPPMSFGGYSVAVNFSSTPLLIASNIYTFRVVSNSMDPAMIFAGPRGGTGGLIINNGSNVGTPAPVDFYHIITISSGVTCTTTTSTTNVTVLSTQLPYIWVDGKPFNAAGTYVKTMPGGNSKGCDSVATLNLTVTNALPAITGGSTVCVGSTASFSNSFSGGVWSISGRGTINASGVVTGTSAGATVIKYSVGSLSVTKNINVVAQPAIPTISYAPGTTGATGNGGICKNKTFTLVGKPVGGTWSSTLMTIDANSGFVTTGNTTGAASVTYTYGNANGCGSSRTIATTVVACKGVTTTNDLMTNDFKLYPNPAHSVINLNIKTLIGRGNIIVTDLYGKQIKQQTLSIGANTIDVSNFAKGIYLVSVITENGKQTQKVVIE